MREDLRILSIVIAGILAIPMSVFATNGSTSHGFGSRGKAMAGAGTAMGLDAMSAGSNPAAMADVGDRFDLGLALFFPERGFTVNEDPMPAVVPGNYESINDIFFVPHIGYNKVLDANSTLGVTLAGNGGMNTEYNSAVFNGFNRNPQTGQAGPFPASSPTGVDLAQMWLGTSYTRKLDPRNTIGVMPLLAAQRIKITGLEPFKAMSVSPNHVTNNGYSYSYGYGLRIGWMGKFNEQFQLGASYQTKTYMTKFDNYDGIIADDGKMDIPAQLNLGLAYHATQQVTVLLDYQRIFYGDIISMANSNQPTGPNIQIGGPSGLGLGWKNQDIFKLGVQWQYNHDFTLRSGYSHASKLFDDGDALFNMIAPATVLDHFTMGVGYRLNDHDELSVSFTHAFNQKVGGSHQFTGTQTGFVEMSQNELEISWGRRF